MVRRYRLADWTTDAGPEEDWLARWAEADWIPEHADGGSWCVVNGHQMKRWSLTRLEDAATSQRIPCKTNAPALALSGAEQDALLGTHESV